MLYLNEEKKQEKPLTIREGPISSFKELRRFKQTISELNRKNKREKYENEIKELQQKEKELTQKIEELDQKELVRERGVIRGQLTRIKKKLKSLNESS